MHRLTEIFGKQRNSVRKIAFGFAAMSEEHLYQLLNLLPNLEEVTIDVSLIKSAQVSTKRLEKLKKIKCLTCRVESAQTVFELSNNVLTKLSFNSVLCDSSPSADLLKAIFEKQKNIEELNFDPTNAALVELPKLKTLRMMKHHNVADILSRQEKLRSLNLEGALRNTEILQASKLDCLQSLTIKFFNNGAVSLACLSGLKNLKELKLSIDKVQTASSICKIESKQLESLELHVMCDVNSNLLLGKLSSNFPRLKHLKLDFICRFIDADAMAHLLKINNLKSLDVRTLKTAREASQFPVIVHQNLKELKVSLYADYSKDFFFFIINSLPNLERFITNNTISDFSLLKTAMVNWKRLTQITFCCQNPIAPSALFRLLKEHGRKLTHFEFEHGKALAEPLLAKFLEMFETQFLFIYSLKEGRRIVMRNYKTG